MNVTVTLAQLETAMWLSYGDTNTLHKQMIMCYSYSMQLSMDIVSSVQGTLHTHNAANNAHNTAMYGPDSPLYSY